MNYLAHCCLVPATPEALAGSLLGDVIHGPDLSHLPAEIERAVRLHRFVDRWTDEHPENLAARSLFKPPLRRFAGIIIDMAYDHFLARNFAALEDRNLLAFSAQVYAALHQYQSLAPARGQARLRYIIDTDLLNQYWHWPSVQKALRGIGSRFSRPTPLTTHVDEITPLLPTLDEHFQRFYPALKIEAAKQWHKLGA
ncbi:ACP phosphodiesterase [Permianibacter aggregans]|uniref:Acyl carrier protein phosphodiesterase n=1 Tax=Permianibacter aggregans TaxID=1510150 RepID=A0A4R6ULW4_9GAMM|nr:ACP phosphodiesterase [Permianibacter aggregans]QGX39136.1 DUF479 domain-containing protein [Permianibacter aggregans]TDQ47652.1 acyl carrier protein phosphodiesterase [Permianibacter aggregans]